MHTHIVAKGFSGPGGHEFKPGEKVDASGWRNTDNLVAHRYLKPIPVTAAAAASPAPPRNESANRPTGSVGVGKPQGGK